MKWRQFVLACALGGCGAIMAGAPAISVYCGIALAALFNYLRSGRGRRTAGVR